MENQQQSMHIKRINIKGFKTYSSQLNMESFSPNFNIIVGKNGSGKSNLFFAIEFVLSDKYSNLRREQRQELLHEGGIDNVMSAYVEIVFDNSDGRFPVDKDEVTLRRTIGLKKDEYFLNRKHTTKSDIVNLLETAGFSRSNPYYMVQQGKILSLADMSEEATLGLLKEVAGTKVYEKKKEESEKILLETMNKKEQIENVLKYIEERLEELEREQEELKKYQELDKKRRLYEHCIYTKEQNESIDRLRKIEKEKEEKSKSLNKFYEQKTTLDIEIKKLESSLKKFNSDLSELKKKKDNDSMEKKELVEKKTKLELDIEDINTSFKNEKSINEELNNTINHLEISILDEENLLKTLEKDKIKYQSDQKNIQERLTEKEVRLQELYNKTAMNKQFNNVKERNKWIEGQLKDVTTSLKSFTQQKEKNNEEMEELEENIKKKEEELLDLEKDTSNKKKEIEKTNQEFTKLKNDRDVQANERKDKWKKLSEVEQSIQNTEAEISKHERQISANTNKAIISGINGVKRLQQEFNISGIHGPLIELFECADPYIRAVEVTAGNALFHIVVEDDKVASEVLKKFNEEKMEGRITMMPLRTLKAKHIKVPDNEGTEPLIDQLKFDEKYRKAFLQIFGRTIVCKNLEVATNLISFHDFNYITLEGDRVDSKGALTGGFYDIRNSKLESYKEIKKLKIQLSKNRESQNKIKNEISSAEKLLNKTLGELQNCENSKVTQNNSFEQLTMDKKAILEDKSNFTLLLQQKKNLDENLKENIEKLSNSKNSLEKEKESPFSSVLNEKEKKEIETLPKQINDIKENEFSSVMQNLVDIDRRINEKNNNLANNLKRRKQQLIEENQNSSFNNAEKKFKLKQNENELKFIETEMEEVENGVEEQEKQIEEITTKVNKLNEQIDTKRDEQSKRSKSLHNTSKEIEKLFNERAIWIEKKEQSSRKIRDVGLTTRGEEVENLMRMGLNFLLGDLKKCNEELKSYNLVNKKAGDQYVSFIEQRDTLQNRKKKLDEDQKSISQLMKVLNGRKNEAIERTFKGVFKNFETVFKELIGEGSTAKLIIRQSKKRKKEEEKEGSEEEEEEEEGKKRKRKREGLGY
eukprot:TRINITY_DN7562_c0_g2_i1.p1 TRINITY_DN7562_c0_g2~~TRINITY_DN7562_c0_g2_i1.p1  ORF type:complete len:1104 (+),score=513.18 TRINITY_DN7562_c0_g2_i1:23-3313(+)